MAVRLFLRRAVLILTALTTAAASDGQLWVLVGDRDIPRFEILNGGPDWGVEEIILSPSWLQTGPGSQGFANVSPAPASVLNLGLKDRKSAPFPLSLDYMSAIANSLPHDQETPLSLPALLAAAAAAKAAKAAPAETAASQYTISDKTTPNAISKLLEEIPRKSASDVELLSLLVATSTRVPERLVAADLGDQAPNAGSQLEDKAEIAPARTELSEALAGAKRGSTVDSLQGSNPTELSEAGVSGNPEVLSKTAGTVGGLVAQVQLETDGPKVERQSIPIEPIKQKTADSAGGIQPTELSKTGVLLEEVTGEPSELPSSVAPLEAPSGATNIALMLEKQIPIATILGEHPKVVDLAGGGKPEELSKTEGQSATVDSAEFVHPPELSETGVHSKTIDPADVSHPLWLSETGVQSKTIDPAEVSHPLELSETGVQSKTMDPAKVSHPIELSETGGQSKLVDPVVVSHPQELSEVGLSVPVVTVDQSQQTDSAIVSRPTEPEETRLLVAAVMGEEAEQTNPESLSLPVEISTVKIPDEKIEALRIMEAAEVIYSATTPNAPHEIPPVMEEAEVVVLPPVHSGVQDPGTKDPDGSTDGPSDDSAATLGDSNGEAGFLGSEATKVAEDVGKGATGEDVAVEITEDADKNAPMSRYLEQQLPNGVQLLLVTPTAVEENVNTGAPIAVDLITGQQVMLLEEVPPKSKREPDVGQGRRRKGRRRDKGKLAGEGDPNSNEGIQMEETQEQDTER